MAVMAWVFPAGQIHKEVTSLTLVNATAKTLDTTVPAGKVWKLESIKAINCDDVDRSITIRIFKEAGKTNELKLLYALTTVTLQRVQWPNNDDLAALDSNIAHEILLEAGNTINVVWGSGGASTGATDADGLVVEYQEVAVSA